MTMDTNGPPALGACPGHPPRAPGRARRATRPREWWPLVVGGAGRPGACSSSSDTLLGHRWHARIHREDGQSLSEYVTVVGLTAATVIACMAIFIAPVARAYIGLFKRLVLQFTSVP